MRRDVHVQNDSTGLIVTSAGLAADARGDDVELGEPGGKAWKKAVQDGLVLPIELVQDDPVVVRVIVDEDLTDEEEAEWVGRLDAKLALPDGALALCGGLDLLEEGLESAQQSVHVLDVPAGTYRATLYAQLPGLNGEHLFARAAGRKKKAEPIGAFFRRTRGKKKFPAWLQAWCVAYPDKDPGHERTWQERTRPDDEAREVLDFVLHLKTLRPRQKADAAKVGKDGWVGLDAWEVRTPELCPLGLAAKKLLRRREPAPRAAEPVELPDLEGLLQGCELTRLGRVDVPIERLGHVFTLAWFATDSSHPELLVESAGDLDLQLEGAHVVREGERLRIGMAVTAGKWDALSLVSKLGHALARLPDESVLELRTACPDMGMGERRHPDAGRQRYRGTLTKGVWRITSAYPRLTEPALRGALELAAEARAGAALTLHSPREAQEVHARVMKEDAFLFESPPLTVDGDRLVLAQPHEALLTMVGQHAFRKRYAVMWSVPDEDEDEDPFADFAEALTKQLAAPTSREVLLEGAFSVYRRADLLALETVDRAEVEATDAALTDLGFTLLGDLVCEKAGDVVIRGYAQPQAGDAWAVLMVGTLGQGGFDFSSDFPGGASLTTTTTPGQSDDARRKSYKKSWAPDTPIPTLWRAHRERLAKMTKKFGEPVAVTADLGALAAAIDASLVRQFSSS